MKFLTISAFLALATAVSALPADGLEKRATCTMFGYTYACTASTTTVTTTTKATAIATTANTKTTTTTKATVTTTKTTATTTKTTTTATATNAPSTGGASQYTTGSTADDISDNTGCTPLTVIFARGTSESGNIGTVAGPPMFKQLLADLGASSLTLQGVDYPASSAGNANCGADGGATMASLVTTILGRCPNTKIALSGYSQGACVVHNAVASQGLDASKIGAVVLFGDPFNGQSVGKVPASKVLEICASGDQVCNGSGTYAITSAHLTYGNNAAQAASFIESQTGV